MTKRSWFLRGTTILCVAIGSSSTRASQIGPFFPPHHFPTDASFHLSYNLRRTFTRSNFVSPQVTEPLFNSDEIGIFQHHFGLEFQPNRNLSAGAVLSIDSVSLNSTNANLASKAGLGDQQAFLEYRFFDEIGASLGAALVAKFPAYGNTTIQEIQDSADGTTVYLGDGQTDLTILLTSEKWFQEKFRLRLDTGMKLRTDVYVNEIPYLLSVAFVTPKVEFDFRFFGNLSMGSGENSADSQILEEAFSNSKYALATHPSLFGIEPRIELWLSTSWALSVDYRISLMGSAAPNFQSFSLGAIYRSAETRSKEKRNFQQVDIRTDQESGQFQGERQLQNSSEPKAVNPTQIIDENQSGADEEFF